MGIVTEETRRESHGKTRKRRRYEMILDNWVGSMTAREIGAKLGFIDLNAVKPRITELTKQGFLYEDSRRFDALTGRTVTTWRKCW